MDRKKGWRHPSADGERRRLAQERAEVSINTMVPSACLDEDRSPEERTRAATDTPRWLRVHGILPALVGRRLEAVVASCDEYGLDYVAIPHVFVKAEDQPWLEFSYDTSSTVIRRTDTSHCSVCTGGADLSASLGSLVGQVIAEVAWYEHDDHLGARLRTHRGGVIELVHDHQVLWDWDIHIQLPGCQMVYVRDCVQQAHTPLPRPRPLLHLAGSPPPPDRAPGRCATWFHFDDDAPWYRWRHAVGCV